VFSLIILQVYPCCICSHESSLCFSQTFQNKASNSVGVYSISIDFSSWFSNPKSIIGLMEEFILSSIYFLSIFLPLLLCPTFNLYGTLVIRDISYFTFRNLIAYHRQSTHSILIYYSVICLIYIALIKSFKNIICFHIFHADSVIYFSFYVQ
jgi:hypothetical protein